MKLTLWKPVGLKECPYLYRIVLPCKWFSIRLHWWVASDDLRSLHDHPWWFLTLVLWGSYTDYTRGGRDILRFGSLRFRPANHKHRVYIHSKRCITLLITGPESRRWAFYPLGTGKRLMRDKYFAEYGHHPCSKDSDVGVRMRPDGTRI